MLYQVNNKAQAVGIVDYSVDNFLSIFETSYDENVKFNANTVGDAGTCHTNRGWQRGTAAVSVSTSYIDRQILTIIVITSRVTGIAGKDTKRVPLSTLSKFQLDLTTFR